MLFAVSVAVMVIVFVVPLRSEVARPWVPRELPMVTAAESDELQIAAVVQSIAVPSENVATALNCCLDPVAIVGLAGVTLIDASFPPREQLMKPIAAAKSATATILPYLRILISSLLPRHARS
jgi:hypothetical protein